MSNVLSKVKTSLGLIGAWVLFLFSHLVPRSKKRWIFLGWHRLGNQEFFADNTKYLFLYASEKAQEFCIEPVWLSPDDALVAELRKRGYRAHNQSSLIGIYHALRAGYTIIDSHMPLRSWKYSGRSKVIQLWHGVPTKLIGHQTPKHVPPSLLLSPGWHIRPRITISTSDWYSRMMAEAFRLNPATLHIAGYPRNDVLFERIENSDIGTTALPSSHASHAGRRFLYAPSFRPDGSNPLDRLDLPRMFDFLNKNDAILFLSLHPKLARHRPTGEERFSKRMFFIDGGYDLYPHLKKFDACITDYSSTATDFLLLDRPVVYYQYDRTEYERGTGLQKCERELAPGPHVEEFDELLTALTDVVQGTDRFAEARKRARTLAFAHRDARSAERVFNLLLDDTRSIKTPPQ